MGWVTLHLLYDQHSKDKISASKKPFQTFHPLSLRCKQCYLLDTHPFGWDQHQAEEQLLELNPRKSDVMADWVNQREECLISLAFFQNTFPVLPLLFKRCRAQIFPDSLYLWLSNCEMKKLHHSLTRTIAPLSSKPSQGQIQSHSLTLWWKNIAF